MIQTILQYQEVDKKLWKIEQDLSKNEERRKAKVARTFLMEAEETIKKIDRKAAELVGVYDKARADYIKTAETLKEYEHTAGTLKSCDEVAYLQKKVNELSELLKNLENELNCVTNEMDAVSKTFNDFGKSYNNARQEYEVNRAKFEEIKKEKADIVASIKQNLDQISKDINSDVMDKYNKKRADKTFPVLVPLQKDNRCGGCSMELSLNEADKIKRDSFIECEHCRRFIYSE